MQIIHWHKRRSSAMVMSEFDLIFWLLFSRIFSANFWDRLWHLLYGNSICFIVYYAKRIGNVSGVSRGVSKHIMTYRRLNPLIKLNKIIRYVTWYIRYTIALYRTRIRIGRVKYLKYVSSIVRNTYSRIHFMEVCMSEKRFFIYFFWIHSSLIWRSENLTDYSFSFYNCPFHPVSLYLRSTT
jgi:hypothetical protein